MHVAERGIEESGGESRRKSLDSRLEDKIVTEYNSITTGVECPFSIINDYAHYEIMKPINRRSQIFILH
jgi:hypothetical protein